MTTRSLSQLRDVIESRAAVPLVRAGQASRRGRCSTFEKALAARMQVKYALGGHLGHRRADHRAGGPGGRAGRRGDPAGLELVLLLQLHRHARRPAGLRRVGRVIQPRSRRPRVEDHPADQGDHGRAHAGQPRRHGRDHGHRPRARHQGAGRLRPEPGRQLQGQAAGVDRRHRHLQLPDRQDDQLGRGRAAWSRTTRSCSSGPRGITTWGCSVRRTRPCSAVPSSTG